MSVLTSYKPDEKKLIEFLKLYGYDYNSIASALSVFTDWKEQIIYR
jgi:hypothetical protein